MSVKFFEKYVEETSFSVEISSRFNGKRDGPSEGFEPSSSGLCRQASIQTLVLPYLPPQPPILTRLYYEGRKFMMDSNSIYTVLNHLW